MPLPSPKGKEERKDFVSRCVSSLTKKGEGKDAAQRVAICNSQWRKAKAELTEAENKAVRKAIKKKDDEAMSEDSDGAHHTDKKKKKGRRKKKGPKYT